MISKAVEVGADGLTGIRWWCPGCKSNHVVPFGDATAWEFDGDWERPTLTPSILINGIRGIASPEWNAAHPRCHSFVRNGRIEFLGDCEHALAGQTVDMVEIPQ